MRIDRVHRGEGEIKRKGKDREMEGSQEGKRACWKEV